MSKKSATRAGTSVGKQRRAALSMPGGVTTNVRDRLRGAAGRDLQKSRSSLSSPTPVSYQVYYRQDYGVATVLEEVTNREAAIESALMLARHHTEVVLTETTANRRVILYAFHDRKVMYDPRKHVPGSATDPQGYGEWAWALVVEADKLTKSEVVSVMRELIGAFKNELPSSAAFKNELPSSARKFGGRK